MNHPILYSFRRCPYAMRARLAISAADQKVELREIILRNKPEHMVEISPKATVPVLLLPTGEVIDESLDIALWALRINDPQNLLTPPTVSTEEMFAFISQNDGPFKHHLDRTKYASRYPEENADVNRAAASQFLQQLNVKLNSEVYLFGNRPCLADITIAPFVRQFANIDRTWFDNQPWPDLLRWLNQFLESELFLTVMEKHKPWQPGDTPLYFPLAKAKTDQ